MSVLPKRHRPGTSWRFLAHESPRAHTYGAKIEDSSAEHPRSQFDELVVDGWLHLEQLGEREWWMQLGPFDINLGVGPAGEAKWVRIESPEGHASLRWEASA